MIRVLLAAILILSACDAAGPGFRGADPVLRTVEGSRFTLRFRGALVEAVRTSPEWLPRFEDVARRAALAAEAERPGCRTAWVEGDPSMMMLGLSCDGAKAPARPKRRGLMVCDLVDLRARGDVAEGWLDCLKG